MKHLTGYTDLFLSPVSGLLATGQGLPDLPFGTVWLGNPKDRPQPSFKLIDLEIDVQSLQKALAALGQSAFIINTPQAFLPQAQVLSDLEDGLVKNVQGFLEKAIANTDYLTPELSENKLWIGNQDNKATPQATISLSNLPSLSQGKVWQGNDKNRPVEVALDSLLPSLPHNKIWIGDANNKPVAQETLTVLNLPALAVGRVWQGDSNGRPEEVLLDYLKPTLEKDHLWLGNSLNRATTQATIGMTNLPALTQGKVWQGNATNRPSEVDLEDLIPPLPHDHLWIGDLNNKPVAQETIAVGNLPALTKGKVWQGSETNRPSEVDLDILKPELGHDKLWIGDINNKPVPQDTVAVGNLPSLTKGKVWQGNELNRPVEVDIPSGADSNASYILQKPDPNLKNAQALSQLVGLPPRILKANDLGVIQVAIADQDYATQETLQRLRNETEVFKDKAQQSADAAAASARRASASAGRATAAATEATAAAATASTAAGAAGAAASEASAAAVAAGGSAFAASLSAIAASGSASGASRSASSASSSADRAKESAQAAETFAFNAEISSVSAATSLATLLSTGLNALPNHGDVNFQGYRAIKAGMPQLPDDLTTKVYVDSAVSGSHIPLQIRGFVQGWEEVPGKLVSTRGPTCLLSAIPAGGNLNLETYKINNLGSPVDATDATSKGYVDTQIKTIIGALNLTGFVQGKVAPDGQIATLRGEACVLSAIPTGGDVDFNADKLVNLGDPEQPQDAATKAYVDAVVSTPLLLTMTGFVEGQEQLDGTMVATRGPDCLLSTIPAGGDINAESYKIVNLADPEQPQDATTKAYVDSLIPGGGYPIRLSGFVEGLEGAKGELEAFRGPTCLLSLIPAGGDVDMGGYRLKTLQRSPQEDLDAVSLTFLWDLLHEEVEIQWS